MALLFIYMEGPERQNSQSREGEIESILEDAELPLAGKAEKIFDIFSESGIKDVEFISAVNGLSKQMEKEEDAESLKDRLAGLEQVDPENPLRKFLTVLLSYKETRDAIADLTKKKV